MKWSAHPNLKLRPPTPSKGRGPLQRQCRRALLAHGGEANTTQILAWCGPRGRSRWKHCYFWLWLALEQIGAERTHRDWKAPGQPWVWRLRNDKP